MGVYTFGRSISRSAVQSGGAVGTARALASNIAQMHDSRQAEARSLAQGLEQSKSAKSVSSKRAKSSKA